MGIAKEHRKINCTGIGLLINMMTIKAIEKTLNCVDNDGDARGWVVYYDKKDKIKEIKNLFNPTAYKGSRPIYNDEQIIEILKKEKRDS